MDSTKKGKGDWWGDGDLTTLDDLHATLSYPLSDLHRADLKQEEEEIFQHYKNWQQFCNHRFKIAPNEGKKFYDLDEVLYYDLMGLIKRRGFHDHFEHIGPYFANAHMKFREMEVVATSKDFGYCSMEQHYWGTSTDGHDFDFKFRITGLLRKRDEAWKWVHEHVSFPVNIATRIADFTCNQSATDHLQTTEHKVEP